MSRTPVREALRKLEDAGLVCTAKNRWTRVAPIEPQDAHDICPIIWTLEPLAIRLGKARGRTPGFEALAHANAQVLEALHNGAAAEAESADERLHGLLTDQSSNPELTKTLGQLRVKFGRIALAYLGGRIIVERSVVDHASMIDALRAATMSAAELSKSHWRSSYNRFSDLARDAEAAA